MQIGDIVTITDNEFHEKILGLNHSGTGCIINIGRYYNVEFLHHKGFISRYYFTEPHLRPASHEEKLKFVGNSIDV